MGERLTGKRAVVTGAGRGIGRAIAELLAAEGAAVVVNDLGGAVDGSGSQTKVADEVVDAIHAAGGNAVASYDSVADFDAAGAIIETAVRELGKYGITANAVCPAAETRMTATVGGAARAARAKAGVTTPAGRRPSALKYLGPQNVAPWVVHLATDAASHVNGKVFLAMGGIISLLGDPAPVQTIEKDGRWTPEEIGLVFSRTLGTDLVNPAPPKDP